MDDQLVCSFFPVEGAWFSIQLGDLGDGRKSICDPLNFDCRVFPYKPDMTQAENDLTMTLRSMGQDMLERKGSILQILA